MILPESVDYILEKHVILLNKMLKRKFTLGDVKPDIRKYFPEKKYENIISIAVGTADYPKTPTYNNLKLYIIGLLNKFPNKKILLLGSGDKQQKTAKDLINEISSERIVDLIDKINLKEVMQIIKDSDLFIGGDSGLYNIAFALNKKIICLHWDSNKSAWEHNFNNVKILKGNGTEKDKNEKYGTPTLNSITFEQIENAINKLGE